MQHDIGNPKHARALAPYLEAARVDPLKRSVMRIKARTAVSKSLLDSGNPSLLSTVAGQNHQHHTGHHLEPI